MFWLWAVTGFSAVTASVTGVGWLVTLKRLEDTRWKLKQAQGHAGNHLFHRCPYHTETGVFTPEYEKSKRDVQDIAQRNRARAYEESGTID